MESTNKLRLNAQFMELEWEWNESNIEIF
jgi:hypothetical protein